MVLVLIIGAGMGWVVRSARIQREAAVAVSRAGGSYTYEWQFADGAIFPSARPAWPEWLVARMGEDYFGHVVKVSINCVQRRSDYFSERDQRRLDPKQA